MDTILNGKYRKIKTIGSGGMGTVYLVENTALGTKWAVKAIRKKESENFDLLAEPNILKKLNHPALPRIIDIDEDEDNLYIIEDYIEGTPLDKQLGVKKKFDEVTVIEWAKQLCNILIYLHNQKPNPVIYRDMKPSNIIVSADNVVKVIDFGIAREFKADSGSDTSYMGTRGYAAPEQYGTSQTDARTDIYSLGATMYHLLTGISPNEPPYEFKPLKQLDSSFSEGIEHIVAKCVQNNPEMRYQSAEELLYDIENIHIFNDRYKTFRRKEKTKKILQGAFALGFSILIVFGATLMMREKSEACRRLTEEGFQSVQLYQLENAETYFNEAIKLKSDIFQAYYGLAQIKYLKGNGEEAIEYLLHIAEEYPGMQKDGEYNYFLGTIYFERKDYENAIDYLKKAVEANSSNEVYLRDLAVSYARTGKLEYANELLKQIEPIAEEEDTLAYINGEILLKMGEKEDAIKQFQRTIDTTNNEQLKRRAFLSLADFYKEERNSEPGSLKKQIKTLEAAEKALANKEDIVIVESLAEAYYENKAYDKAADKFEKLIALGYNRAYVYRNLAIIYQLKDDYKTAEAYLDKMVTEYPDEYTCYLQYAYLYLEKENQKSQASRDYTSVVSYYNQAVKFAPEGEQTSDLLPLAGKIKELKAKGWL